MIDAEPHVVLTVEQAWQPVPGGSGRYVAELTGALQGIVRTTGLSAWHRNAAPADWAPAGPIRRTPLPRLALYEAWQRLRLPRAEWTVPDADVVHATTWAIPPTRRPLVVTVHDLAFLDEPEHFTRRGTAFFRRALATARDAAAETIVPSRTTRDACVAAGFDSERLHVVPHGVSLPEVGPEDVARFRIRYALTRPYVLWVGTREPRKNLPAVRRAFAQARLAGYELVIVGPRGWGTEDAPTAGERLLGPVMPHDLACAYHGARAFCFPSFREGFGLPVLEAMSASVPVVTSAGTACAEVGGDACLRVEPTDVDALAAALQAACGERHDELAAVGAERAARFTWDACARATAEVYASALGR